MTDLVRYRDYLSKLELFVDTIIEEYEGLERVDKWELEEAYNLRELGIRVHNDIEEEAIEPEDEA